MTGEVRRGRRGPTAIRTKVGWVLSGPASCQETSANLVFTTTHALKIEVYPTEPSLDDQLRQFWELESLGIAKNEPSVYESFVQRITFDGKRYQVGLPWKEGHLPLPDNLELCRRRLRSLLRRLRQDLQLLTQYNSIIEDQVWRGLLKS